MNRIFLDPERRRDWLSTGYTRVPVLSREEAAALLDQCMAIRSESELRATDKAQIRLGCHSSFDDGDPAYRRRIFELVRDLFMPRLEAVLDRYQMTLGGIFVKTPGADEVPLHSDWTFTADVDAVSLNVWCPLVDVDDSNSGLRLVAGSHRLFHRIGAPGVPPFFASYEKELKEGSTLMDLRAGEAVIFDSNLLHWSRPNRSESIRPAVAFICVPRSATPAMYRRDKERGRFELFDMSDGGFFAHSARELFEGTIRSRSLGFVEDRNRPVSQRQFERLRARGDRIRRRFLPPEEGAERPLARLKNLLRAQL
ncbi:MAG: phytanoyl-CoA dioxygenase family protein [Pseudomonadota bacterium]|nr:phytanoyl-CoA dioxygenase family protein [Pseudomonadota bacterium]